MNKKFIILCMIILVIVILITVINHYLGGFIIGNNEHTALKYGEKVTVSHIIENEKNDKNQVSVVTIYSFNNKNVCVSQRMQYNFSNTDEANKQYNTWKEITSLENISISDTIVSFNTDKNVGNLKETIITDLKNNSKDYVIY